jgi:NADPH2:quinone reductase
MLSHSWPSAGRGEGDLDDHQPAKAKQARALGFDDVIDLATKASPTPSAASRGPRRGYCHRERRRCPNGSRTATLGLNGVLTSLGYSAGRKTTIDVTDLIWKHARMNGFALAAQSHPTKAAAWATILPLLTSGQVKPIVERTYRLGEAAEALPPSDRRPSLWPSGIGG